MSSIQFLNEEKTNRRIKSILKRQPKILTYKSRTNSEERQYITEESEHHEDEEKEHTELYPHLYQTINNYCALTDHTSKNPEEEAIYIPIQQIGNRIKRAIPKKFGYLKCTCPNY